MCKTWWRKNMNKIGRIVKPMVAISVADNYDEAKHEWRVTGAVWGGPPLEVIHLITHINVFVVIKFIGILK